MSQGRIHFDRGRTVDIWTWRAHKSKVVIQEPNRKKYVVNMTDVTGCTWPELERSRWKQTRTCEVTPAKVRRYIEKNLKRRR